MYFTFFLGASALGRSSQQQQQQRCARRNATQLEESCSFILTASPLLPSFRPAFPSALLLREKTGRVSSSVTSINLNFMNNFYSLAMQQTYRSQLLLLLILRKFLVLCHGTTKQKRTWNF